MLLHKPILSLIALFVLWSSTGHIVAARPMQTKSPAIHMKSHNSQEFTLENGLKVIIREDHSAPIIAQAIFYRVGSRNDKPGFTGAAHFLEHMQFNGTSKRGKDQISDEIESRGGTFNAATSTDFTYYYMTMPKGNLDFSLELEADRMRNSIINEEEATREKQVVIQELKGRENNPFEIVYRELLKNSYPDGHPYGVPIIGWEEDIRATTGKNLLEHYNNYYQPNNAILILVGDLDAQQALNKIQQFFGGIPPSKQQIPKPKPNQNPTPSKQYAKIQHPTESNIFSVSWNTVSFANPDYVALSVLASVLSEGDLSRLHKKLVDAGEASFVNASMRQGIDPFTFSIFAGTTTERSLEKIKSTVLSELEDIRQNGISESELERIKAKTETEFLLGLEDPTNVATQLGIFEVVSGDWKRTFNWPEELNRVTTEDIQRVAQKYLTLDHQVITELYGTGSASKSIVVNTSSPVEHIANYRANSSVAVGETTPSSEPWPKITYHIEFAEQTLPNGMRTIVRDNPSNPVVAITALVDAGSVFRTAGNSSVAYITSEMLSRGTKSLSRDEFNSKLDSIGASLEVGPQNDYVQINMRGRSRDLPTMLQLLASLLIEPSFSEEELNKLKSQVISNLEQSKDDFEHLIEIAQSQAIYPVDHPYYESNIDTSIAEVNSLTEEELRDFHRTHYSPKRTVISISGDVRSKAAFDELNHHFDRWKNTSDEQRSTEYYIPPVSPSEPKIRIEELPGKSQALVMLTHTTELSRRNPDYYSALLASDILGGGSMLSSRLGKRVRGEHGLVYYVYSKFAPGRSAGPFSIRMGVAPERADEAVAITRDELNSFLNSAPMPNEVQRAKNYRTGQFISRFLVSNSAIASSAALFKLYGMSVEELNDYTEKLNGVSLNQIQSASQKYITPDKLHTIIYRPTK